MDPCSIFLLAQAHGRESLLTWAVKAMGPFYTLVLPATGLAMFAGAVLVVALNRRPGVIAAYLVFLPLPALIGIYGTVQGVITASSQVAIGGGEISPSQQATIWAVSLFTTLVGLLVSFPSYLVLAVGLFLRTLLWRGEKSGIGG